MRKKAPKNRTLSANEKTLWQRVTKDVKHQHQTFIMPEIRVTPKVEAEKFTLMPETKIVAQKPKLSKKIKRFSDKPVIDSQLKRDYLDKLLVRYDKTQSYEFSASKQSIAHFHNAAETHNKPLNTPLDRNIRTKLQRGRADIEARLDLHGYNRINAQNKLMQFLKNAWHQGQKTVIVVTGKGDGPVSRQNLHSADFYQMPEQTAVLKSSISGWLNSPEAQNYVIGWQPAHPKHGGGGAVYVRIRNKSKQR